MYEPPDCRVCGLCCTVPMEQHWYCGVTQEDFDRLDRRWADKNVYLFSPIELLGLSTSGKRQYVGAIKAKPAPHLKGLSGQKASACVALRGTPGKRVSCMIYDRRPAACREEVIPGDKTCRLITDPEYKKDEVEAAVVAIKASR